VVIELDRWAQAQKLAAGLAIVPVTTRPDSPILLHGSASIYGEASGVGAAVGATFPTVTVGLEDSKRAILLPHRPKMN